MAWLVRGLAMAVVHIVVRILLAQAVVHQPLNGLWWKTLAVVVVVLVSIIWGGVDGIVDGRAHEDSDDYADLTVRWLKAGVLAGVITGVVGFILANFVFAGMGMNSIFIEIFAGGSFTALLIFMPALVGVTVGRFLARRQRRSQQKNARDDREQDNREYADA